MKFSQEKKIGKIDIHTYNSYVCAASTYFCIMITLCCLVIDFFAPTNRHGSMFMFIHWMLHCQFDGVEYSSLNILGCDFIISRCLMNSCCSLLLSLLLFRAYHQIIMKTTFFHSTRFFIDCMYLCEWCQRFHFFSYHSTIFCWMCEHIAKFQFLWITSAAIAAYTNTIQSKRWRSLTTTAHISIRGAENNEEKEMQMVKIIKKAANMMFA